MTEDDKNIEEDAATVSSSASAVSAASAATPCTIMTGCSALRPTEISYFLMVYMQEGDADAVINALATLIGSMPQDKDDFLTEEWQQKKDMLMWNGAPALTTLIMKKWQDHEQIQIGSSIFFTALCCGIDNGPSAIAACGGVEAVVNALRAFPDSCDVQGSGFGALANVFANLKGFTPQLRAAHQFVNELDGLDLIQAAMRKFPDRELQGRCCLLLGNLAMVKPLRKSLSIIMVEVSRALRDHSECDEVKTSGKTFMRVVLA